MTEKYYNEHIKITTYKEGQLVIRKNEASCQEHMGKLSPNWEEHYRVIKARCNASYVMETMVMLNYQEHGTCGIM